jgi:hypothetical protein
VREDLETRKKAELAQEYLIQKIPQMISFGMSVGDIEKVLNLVAKNTGITKMEVGTLMELVKNVARAGL